MRTATERTRTKQRKAAPALATAQESKSESVAIGPRVVRKATCATLNGKGELAYEVGVDGRGDVLCQFWESVLRAKAVIDVADQEARLRIQGADAAVDALVAVHPAAAVYKDEDRIRRLTSGDGYVQPLQPVGTLHVRDVLDKLSDRYIVGVHQPGAAPYQTQAAEKLREIGKYIHGSCGISFQVEASIEPRRLGCDTFYQYNFLI